MMAEERYYKHDGFERFTHWTHTLDTVILVLSGLPIHTRGSPSSGDANARFLHLVSAYIFVGHRGATYISSRSASTGYRCRVCWTSPRLARS